MVEKRRKTQNPVKDASLRVAKAAVHAILIYILYMLTAMLLAPLLEYIPGITETIEAFVMVFTVFMILGDLTRDTIFHHFLNTARSLFVIAYLLLAMGNGMISANYESFTLTLNLTTFYTFAAVLSLLGFARSIMQTIHYLNERGEAACVLQTQAA
jgi:hypothetical protein